MADDELLDQDIDHELEPTPLISKALIGRFLAVGVFVALGTFAVIQSVTTKKDVADDHSGHAHANVIDDVGASIGNTVAAVGDKTKKGLDDFLGGAKNVASSTVSSVKNAASSTAASVKNAASSTTASLKDKVSSATSGFRSGTAQATGGFNASPKNSVLPPKPIAKRPLVDPAVKKVAPSFGGGFAANGLTAKTTPKSQPKPPERLAQNGGFLPTVGKQGLGAAGDTAAAALTKMQISKPPTGFKTNTDTATNTFNDLKRSINSGVNSLSSKAGDAAKSTAAAVDNKFTELGTAARKSFSSPLSERLEERSKAGGFPRPIQVDRPKAPSNSFGSSSNPFNASKAPAIKRTQQRDPFGGPAESKVVKAPSARRTFEAPAPKRPATQQSRTQLVSSPRQTFSKPQNDRAGSSSRSPVAQLASAVTAMGTPGERRLEGVQAPSLTVEKVSPREIQVDQAADFEIRVRNVGRVAADNVMVIDRVPDGTEFLGAEPAPARGPGGSGLQWDIGTLTPGQEKRIRYQLKPTQPGEIGSVAQVVFATQASMRTVVTKPVLSIEHDTTPKVLMGDNFVFDVIVENQGDGAAADVIISEEVPAQLEYQAGFRQLEYEVGTLMPGQKKKLRLALRAGKVGKFRNVMYASGKGGLEAKHALDLEVVAPEIRVKCEGPSKRYLQRKALHQFTIENRGTAKATNVDLVARLPSGLRYVSADNRGRYDSQSHAVYWKMPELTDGVAGTVELTTIPVSVGQQNIKFEAEADLKLFASTDHALTVEHLIDIFFDIDDAIDPIEVGSGTNYRMRVVNQGTKAASNVLLQVDFPPGLLPESVDGNLRHQIKGQRVVFEPISSMPPGQEVTMSINATGKSPGDHRVVANIRADGREVAFSKEDTTRVYSDR